MSVLITGGAGYIGSHTSLLFLEAGHDVVVVDNLTNSHLISLERVADITGRKVHFEKLDIRDKDGLCSIMKTHHCDSVVHFAGLKAVGESNEIPLSYYDNNVVGSLRLLEAMNECDVRKIIFSSSATVYGVPQYLPLTESHPLGAINPYGRTKQMIEDVLRDLAASDPRWGIMLLRYFNPVGGHESGLIGENPIGIPNNLMPFIAQVASGRREQLSVFGDDYETLDGTGVRDYIHVMDLARGHLAAHDKLSNTGCHAVNLGTGTGYSVFEMIRAFERASNQKVAYQISPRREGDVASCYADTSLAQSELGWKAERDLEAMCADTWNWIRKNPKGYEGT